MRPFAVLLATASALTVSADDDDLALSKEVIHFEGVADKGKRSWKCGTSRKRFKGKYPEISF